MATTRRHLRLGVNIDHVATIRNAAASSTPIPSARRGWRHRRGRTASPRICARTRRHISDDDISRLSSEIDVPLNLEMAATDEMLKIALRHKPHAACIVPEKRAELTTEGGLDAVGGHNHLARFVRELVSAKIPRLAFHRPRSGPARRRRALGAPVVELPHRRLLRSGG